MGEQRDVFNVLNTREKKEWNKRKEGADMKKNSSGFLGGIHPTDGSDKALTVQAPVTEVNPELVEISMEQTPGNVCRLLVKEGDFVHRGQLIGIPQTFAAAAVHASVTGHVTKIKKTGSLGEVCVIRAEEADTAPEVRSYQTEWMENDGITREDILRSMEKGGIIGMGGAGFPAFRKYQTEKNIQTILVNAAECEPYLTCDHILMREQPMGILNGIQLLIKAAGAAEAVLCIEDNKPDVIENFRTILKKKEVPIRLQELPTMYPQGGERQLIQSVLDMEVPSGGLPADVGVIVSNVATANAVADMVFAGLPLIRRYVTVSGCVERPGNFLVPVGTRFQELLRKAGDVSAGQNQMIVGGPMTGYCIGTNVRAERAEGAVSKATSGILILPEQVTTETPCIRCGACGRVCPAGLNPFKIDFAYRNGKLDVCRKLYATECIGCGACSYVCPARIELAFRNIAARNAVKQTFRKKGVIQ